MVSRNFPKRVRSTASKYDAQRPEIVEYAKTHGQKEVCEKFGIPSGSWIRVAHKFGIPTKKQKPRWYGV